VLQELHAAARSAMASGHPGPLYLRLAEALTPFAAEGDGSLPSARSLATTLHVGRGTVTAAYRELSRIGLVDLRPGRPRRRAGSTRTAVHASREIDLARYAPDQELLPSGRLFAWLGAGSAEGESVAQYGDTQGFRPLRDWVAARLRTYGVGVSAECVLLTGGLQNALDLVMRAELASGDEVLVEDPTYPGLPPLLALHGLVPVPLRITAAGHALDTLDRALAGRRVKLAVLTPTLHNPSGTVLDEAARRDLLDTLRRHGCLVIEEFFDPALVCSGDVPSPLGALDADVLVVGSFSKALFPGLRVGWVAGRPSLLARVARVKQGTDLGGSPFLEAAAWTLCSRGVLDNQCNRLREAARERGDRVLAAFERLPSGVTCSRPRGGFSVLVELLEGVSATAVATAASSSGVKVLPGPAMSVSGRDDVLRVAYAAAGGAELQRGLETVVRVLAEPLAAQAMV
jgi:DNA-binding transcriptional MocR family regulator